MRRLMWCALGYTLALLLAHYIFAVEYLLPFAAGCALAALAALLLRRFLGARPVLLLFSAALGFLWMWAYCALFITPAEALVGRTLQVEARVTDYPVVQEDYSSVELRLEEDWAPRSRVIVYDYEGALGELVPGDELSLELRFISAALRSSEESDYYLSSGVHLRAYLQGEYLLLGQWEGSFLHWPKQLAHSLKAHILELFPGDISALMKALLTGDKSEFYEDDALYTAMKTAGMTHIIAVSGMHVSFILGLLRMWTGKRRASVYIGIPLLWFFAAMSGFSPSVVRACTMATLMLAAPLLGRENDPPTALSAAALILLLVNPKAVGSIGLQLSFAAMAGIIIFTPAAYSALGRLFEDTKGIFARLLRSLSALLSSSLGAIIFTTPLAALHFGYVPVYSVLSNCLCLWAMSAAFMAGFVICIIGAVCFPLGSFLASLLSWLPRYSIFVVELIARAPFAALSTHNKYIALWLVFAYAVLFIPWLFGKKQPYRPIIPLCCCIVGLLASLTLAYRQGAAEPEICAVDVGQGQCIIAGDGESTLVIDCGGKAGSINAGDLAADQLLASGRSRIDLLILTHLHDDHANGLIRLINRIPVGCLILPEDCEDTEFRDSIIDLCYDKDIDVRTLSKDSRIMLGSMTLDVFAPFGSEDPNERGLIVFGSISDFEFLVTGDAGAGTEKLLMSFYDIGDIDLLVAGHHGSAGSTCAELLEETRPEYALISVGANNYGHPAGQVLGRLLEAGAQVFRTDINGTITIRTGTENG